MTAHAASGLGIYDYAMLAYFAAYALYALHAFSLRRAGFGWVCTVTLAAAFAMHTAFMVQRALFYNAQYQGFVLPATNMFEAISYFAWLIVLLYLVVDVFFIKTRVFGVFALIIPVAAMAYSTNALSADPRELMPSLKSYWLVFHISAMFISYAAFTLACTFAVMYVLRAHGIKSLERIDPKYNLRFLDDASYRMVLLGFPMLTLGVFLGAVWAFHAWGRYWGWDPKETWALITWFVYLAYLHFRLQWNFVGYRSALMNTIGFAVAMVTFLGVNLLDYVFNLHSIHTYAEGGGPFVLAVLGLAVFIPLVMHFLPKPPEEGLRTDEDLGEEFKPAADAGDPRPPVDWLRTEESQREGVHSAAEAGNSSDPLTKLPASGE
jgi:cytochrome c-type biogenesis protein CcsB